MFAFGRSPVTPPAALLAKFTVEKFISDVNSEPPLRSTMNRWEESARIVSTPAAGVTAVPASAKAPQPDTPAPQVGGDDPSARLVAVKVVNAPLFGVIDPIVPGEPHGTMDDASRPEDNCGMSLPVVPKAIPLVIVDEVPKIATYPVVPPEMPSAGQLVPVTKQTALPPIVVAAARVVVLDEDSVVKAPELGVVLPIVPGVAHGIAAHIVRPVGPALVNTCPAIPRLPPTSYAKALKVSDQLRVSS